MALGLSLPLDDLAGEPRNPDPSADFLELAAFFAEDSLARTSDIANEASIGAEEEPTDLDAEMQSGVEEIVNAAVDRIDERIQSLGSAYPFRLDDEGDILTYQPVEKSLGRGAYILCLVLSNLHTPVLGNSRLLPADDEIRRLRQLFQYVGTAALAAEIQGRAWSFGFPRPDGSSFLTKLEKIWSILGDGSVTRNPGAPGSPKDDGVDVFAARLYPDRMPGFLLAAAQVATGKRWKEKSLLGKLNNFRHRWFSDAPVTRLIEYMIVPFAISDAEFRDHVSRLGNILHRVRVPVRASEARRLVEGHVDIEAYDQLQSVVEWVASYRGRAVGAA